MSQPHDMEAQPSGRTPALIGVGAGLGVNLAVYLVAWWVSKSVGDPRGGGDMSAFDAATEVLCWGTALILMAGLMARRLLIRVGHPLVAKGLTIGTLLPIVLAPGIAILHVLITMVGF